MKIIFWQNSISMHQVSFIKALASDYDVSLFVEQKITSSRSLQGWEVPETGQINVQIVNSSNFKKLILSNQDGFHLFSGINAYPIISKAFRKAAKLNLFIAIMAEPQNWLGVKGLLNKARSMLFFSRYRKKIDLMLAIGSRGKSWYASCGMPSCKIFEWVYFVEKPKFVFEKTPSLKQGSLPNLLFVGRLVKMKGIYELIEILKTDLYESFNKLVIIGDGAEYNNLQKLVSELNLEQKIHIKGQFSHKDIWSEYLKADYLILPSIKKEGWGAVINEALLSGIPVIASDYCGASLLITEKNGYVFKASSKDSLRTTLVKALNNRSMFSFENKINIQEHSETVLNIDSYISYFISIINASINKKNFSARAPWCS